MRALHDVVFGKPFVGFSLLTAEFRLNIGTKKLHSNQQSEATFRAYKYTAPPPCLRSQENHTTCAPCFAEGHSGSVEIVSLIAFA